MFTSEFINGTPVAESISSHQSKPLPSRDHRALQLGDVASPQDMHIESDHQRQYENVASLPVHSFAYILRSTGEWTYAIIADRPVKCGPNASIMFVLNDKGSTKTIKAKDWGKYIRPISGSVKKQNSEEVGRVKKHHRKTETRESMPDVELAKLTSFHRAARRVSIDMSKRTCRKSCLRHSSRW